MPQSKPLWPQLASRPASTVWVADSDKDQIRVFGGCGELPTHFDESGKALIADTGNNRVQVFQLELP